MPSIRSKRCLLHSATEFAELLGVGIEVRKEALHVLFGVGSDSRTFDSVEDLPENDVEV
jgi:hypothetical protein